MVALAGGLVCLLATTGPVQAVDGSWLVEASVASVAVDGIRTYAVPSRKLAKNDRSHVAAGSLRIARDFGDRWSAGVAYTRYGQLRASGASGTPDIFEQGGIALQVVVPLEMVERIDEWSLDARRRWQVSPRLAIEAGPVLSCFISEAELGTSNLVGTIGSPITQRIYSRIANYSATDFRLGGWVEAKMALTSRLSASIAYRYAAPSNRSLHIGSVGISWRF